jgi:hypothetical protein
MTQLDFFQVQDEQAIAHAQTDECATMPGTGDRVYDRGNPKRATYVNIAVKSDCKPGSDSWSVMSPARPHEATPEPRDCRAGSLAHDAMNKHARRRRFGQEPLHTRVFVSLPAQEALVEGIILDMDTCGLRLICPEPLTMDAELLLVFQVTTRNEIRADSLFARVMRTQMDDDVWVVQLKFHKVLDRQRMSQLVPASARRVGEGSTLVE